MSQAMPIIDKLAGSAEVIFRVPAMNDLYTFIFVISIRVMGCVVHSDKMSSLYKAGGQPGHSLFISSIMVGDTSCT
jgi:hypothetical protein